jgi:hypothetical protein
MSSCAERLLLGSLVVGIVGTEEKAWHSGENRITTKLKISILLRPFHLHMCHPCRVMGILQAER